MKCHLEQRLNISYQVQHIHSFSIKIKSTNAGEDLGVTVDTRLNIKITVSSNCKKSKPQTGVHQEEHGQKTDGSCRHLKTQILSSRGIWRNVRRSSRGYHHGQRHMSCGERLKEPGLSSPLKRWISGDTGAACNCWKGNYKDRRAKLFSVVTASTRGNGATATRCSLGSSNSTSGKKICTGRVVQPGNRSQRGRRSASLEFFRVWLLKTTAGLSQCW